MLKMNFSKFIGPKNVRVILGVLMAVHVELHLLELMLVWNIVCVYTSSYGLETCRLPVVAYLFCFLPSDKLSPTIKLLHLTNCVAIEEGTTYNWCSFFRWNFYGNTDLCIWGIEIVPPLSLGSFAG